MISIKTISRPRLTVPVFRPEQMRDIGELARAGEAARLSQGLNLADAPARPLRPGYALQKKRAGLQPVRDLRFTGAMLESRQVVSAEPNGVTLGFDDARQAAKAERNERIEPMLGISQVSRPAIDASVRERFSESIKSAK